MPITFVVPPSGTIGPGIGVSWSSDVQGPLEIGTFWRWRFYQGAEPTEYYLRCLQDTDTQVFPGTFPFTQPIEGQHEQTQNIIGNGQAAHLFVELVDSGGVIDSGTLNANWDTETGTWPMVEAIKAGISTGLTPTQAQQLADIKLSVTNQISAGPPEVLQRLSDLIWQLPAAILNAASDLGEFQGRGTLPDPGWSQSNFGGLIWTFTALPAHIGRRDGTILEYTERILQLTAFHTVAGRTFVSDLHDANYEGVLWRFKEWGPSRIDYDILPFCAVRFTALRWAV